MNRAEIESYLTEHAINQTLQDAVNGAVKARAAEPKVHVAGSLLEASGLQLPVLADALKKLGTEAKSGSEALKFLVAELTAPRMQSAFVFTKPHANTEQVRELIATKFKSMGIEVVTEGDMDGPTIDAKKRISAATRTLVCPPAFD